MPPDARRSLRLYNLFFPLVFLALLPGFLVRMLRRGNYRAGFGQRLGFYTAHQPGAVWIHSISVGETLVALKLARAWHAAHPEARLLLSVTTTTGLALAQQSAAAWLEPIYNPVDFRPIVRRALRLLQPARIILIEGEAWPNLLAESHARGVPVALANARLSPRSERRFRRFRAWTGPIFRLLEQVLVPEPGDVGRWESLGVPAEKLHVTGSIKFDEPAGVPARVEEFRWFVGGATVGQASLPVGGGVLAGLQPAGAGCKPAPTSPPTGRDACPTRPDACPTLVAGSTHAGEELLLAQMLPALRAAAPGLLLLIAPRHVERVPALLRELAPAGLRIARRTENPPPGSWDLLLLDTTGELRDWYALATVVFVGKSLTAIGGQNPAEPALLGRPVIFGPHMENFAAVVAHLLAAEGAVQVPDVTALQAELARLLTDPAARAALASRAATALAGHQGATARALALLR